MVEEFRDISSLPLPEEVKRAVEEILGEQKAKEELMKMGVLGLMQRKGGEIRLVKRSGETTGPQIGRYREDDLPELVEIVNENYMDYPDFFYEYVPYTKETLRSKLEGRPIVLVARNHTIEGFVTCYVAPWGTTIDTLCVKKGPDRIKIEDMLISKVEEGAKGWKVVIFLGSDSPRIADFEKRGYEIYGGLYHMTVKLDHVYPIPPVPKGAVLRSMREGDAERITKAFYDPEKVGPSIFKPGFTEIWKEDWNHLADLNGKIVSVLCTRPENKYNEHYHKKRAEIWGHTPPEHRWKGFEEALISRAFNSLREKGMEVAAVVDTETPPEFINLYKSLGFKVRKHWKFLRRYHKNWKLHEIR